MTWSVVRAAISAGNPAAGGIVSYTMLAIAVTASRLANPDEMGNGASPSLLACPRQGSVFTMQSLAAELPLVGSGSKEMEVLGRSRDSSLPCMPLVLMVLPGSNLLPGSP